MTTKISAAVNPALANDLLNQALQEEPKEIVPEITPPLDTTVELPGGYVTTAGEVFRTAEVRELNGRDEEEISKTTTLGKALLTILQRGTVKIGDEIATEALLDSLLIGDRDALLIGILKTTFGNTVEIPSYCSGCEDYKSVAVDITKDLKMKILVNPIDDRVFTVKGKTQDYVVQLPNGTTQKEMISNAEKSSAELSSIMLERTVLRIGESPVYSKAQVQNLSVVDRRSIIEAINNRAPGPQFDEVSITCPDCGNEVNVPINLGALFRF
jgi:hypothetical protein